MLGFSKGGDQQEMIDLYLRGRKRFEDIPFNSTTSSMRRDLVELLVTMGLCPPRQQPDALFRPNNPRFGFASLIRCSASMLPHGKLDYVFSGQGILEHTIRSEQSFVLECVRQHLMPLPTSVRLVVMLGSSKDYIEACRDILGGEWSEPTAKHRYVYRANEAPFVHVPHPSGQAGGFRAVFNCKRMPTSSKEDGMPDCRRQVLAAVVQTGIAAV